MTITLNAETILENTRALVPEIRSASDRIEAERCLPDDLLEKLTSAGVFRIAMPEAWGGSEMDPLMQIELIEAIAQADASAAWLVMITSDSGFYTAWLEDDVAREMYPNLDMRTAGLMMPAGQALCVDGGYRVTGQWAFGSGCSHADWLVGGSILIEDGAPRLAEGGLPEWRVVCMPRPEVEILDTWHTTGLAGSGSHDYRVADLFVPHERTFSIFEPIRRPGPLYQYHGMFFANLGGVPLGLARATIDELVKVANQKTTFPSMSLLRDDYRVQEAVGRAEGILGSARAFVFDTLGDAWHSLQKGDKLSLNQRARMSLMTAHACRAGQDVVRLAYDTAGSASIYQKSPLDRYFRDAATIGAHMLGQQRAYAGGGQVMLGLDPSPLI